MSNEAVAAIDPNLEKLQVEEAIEDRRATRDFKFWMAKTLLTAFLAVLTASVVTLIYAAVIQEKDFNTGIIGETFKGIFEILRIILS